MFDKKKRYRIVVVAIACACFGALLFLATISDRDPIAWEVASANNSFLVSASVESGCYENSIEVSLSAPDGLDIYYSLDGEVPSPTHGCKYQGTPIVVSGDDAVADTLSSELIKGRVIDTRPNACVLRAATFLGG